MKKMNQATEILVLGGGPAGGTAALFAARIGRRVTLLTGPAGGSLITGTEVIDNFPGMARLSGREFTANLLGQCRDAGAEVVPISAARLEIENRYKIITDEGGRVYRSPALIIATGTSPILPAIAGIDRLWGKGISFCAWCDGSFFRGKRVAVYGGGNTAFTSATILSRLASEVHLLLPKKFSTAFGSLKNEVSRTANIKVSLEVSITAVAGDNALREIQAEIDHEPISLPMNGLFITLGQTPNTGWLRSLPALTTGGFIEADLNGLTSIPGIFAAGDVVADSFRQLAVACGGGATAALGAEQYLNHQWRTD